jgi:hypothetical protein
VETTLSLFRRLVRDPHFLAGDFDVPWLERRLEQGILEEEAASAEDVLLAVVSLSDAPPEKSAEAAGSGSLWRGAARREALRR